MQALAISTSHGLPITARSLTRREYIGAERKAWDFVLGVPAFLLFLWPFYSAFELDFDFAFRFGPWMIGAALILWAILFFARRRAGRGYVDPRTKVEVAEIGITFTEPGRRELVSWPAASLMMAETLHRGDYFHGLRLDSPLGPIRLDNSHFKWGRTAAALLYGQCVAAGACPAPPRAEAVNAGAGEGALIGAQAAE
ncbi:hypothetical protein [Sphingosinicella terrae]|uniref:hypothetical protein n=1 Tax=Sphingosinicella terrae TaxID=2172047 RepID=UPI000E0DBE2A|nr:hypothetical protein [Sphingosinicella terrae]